MSVKLLIIGGVAGGATAAARARRIDEKAEIILFERGEYVSFANCGLPYYIGGTIEDRDDLLVTTADSLRGRYNIDVRIFSEVVSIDRKEKTVTVKDHRTGKTYTENYDKIILSPGAEPVVPPLEGVDLENIFRVRNLPDTDKIKAMLDTKKPESAVIIGAGFIGLEMAENLTECGIKVTVIEMLDQVMPAVDVEIAAIIEEQLQGKGVDLKLGCGVKSFKQKGKKLTVHDDKGGETECDIAILSIGVKPDSVIAKGCGLELNQRGGIIVDSSMRTSDPDIFAVGDAVELKDIVSGMPCMTALAGPANRQGRIAADNALGRSSVYKGAQGTAIVKVFDMVAASTGLSEKQLQKYNIPYVASYTHSGSHASYYPGAETITIKLLFSPGNGKILGAQAAGSDGVDKRMDVLSTALRSGLSVFDLEELELAYAPPFSSAKDPVNIAGYVASNIVKGDVKSVAWNSLKDFTKKTGCVIIDLRDADELEESGKMKESINIPLNDLRSRVAELDKTKAYLLHCAGGLRSYIGCRIMMQNGFNVFNFSGGYTIYDYVKDRI